MVSMRQPHQSEDDPTAANPKLGVRLARRILRGRGRKWRRRAVLGGAPGRRRPRAGQCL